MPRTYFDLFELSRDSRSQEPLARRLNPVLRGEGCIERQAGARSQQKTQRLRLIALCGECKKFRACEGASSHFFYAVLSQAAITMYGFIIENGVEFPVSAVSPTKPSSLGPSLPMLPSLPTVGLVVNA